MQNKKFSPACFDRVP